MAETSSRYPYTEALQTLMRSCNITSFKQLGELAGVSEAAIARLRQGHGLQMQAGTLCKLANVLEISVDRLLQTCTSHKNGSEPVIKSDDLEAIKTEYDRLQQQFQQQRTELWQEFQQTSLQTLEPWLLQWSAAAHAAQKNPQAPAVKLLPLLRPIEQLLQQWDITAIDSVGETVSYDPHRHQLMGGTANSGDPVQVRFSGYRQGDRILYRSKVSPIVSC